MGSVLSGAVGGRQVRDLIYREALEYHPQAKREYYSGEAPSRFVFPSAVDNFKRQCAPAPRRLLCYLPLSVASVRQPLTGRLLS